MITTKHCNWRGNNTNQFLLILPDGLALIAARWKKASGPSRMFTILSETILSSFHYMLMIVNCCLLHKDLLIKRVLGMIKKLKLQEINGQHSRQKILQKHHNHYTPF